MTEEGLELSDRHRVGSQPRWVDVQDGRTLLARSGRRHGRPVTYVSKLNWRFDPEMGLAIGAAAHAGPVSTDTVPATFIGLDGVFKKLNRSYPLGHDLWLMAQLHKHGDGTEVMTPPLPNVYAVLPEYEMKPEAVGLNPAFITDQLMRVARGEAALQLERAPEAMFASGDPDARCIHVRFADGNTDTWTFPAGTQIRVPLRGTEVVEGQIIAHIVPRHGWRGLQTMSPQAMAAARADIIDQFTHHDVHGLTGYDLRLFNGALPTGTRAYVNANEEQEFVFACTPTRLVGRVGMIHFNFLSNWYDRRLPAIRPQRRQPTHHTLTSPLMGTA